MEAKFISIYTVGNYTINLNTLLIEYIRGEYLGDNRTLIVMNSGARHETLTPLKDILQLIKDAK